MDRRRCAGRAVAALAMAAAAGMAVDGGVVLGVNAAGAQPVQIVGAGTSGCASAYCFSPSQASSNRGDTVTFSNASGGTHTVTRCTAGVCSGQGPGTGADTLDSGGSISPNGTYGHTFSSGGTYFYYCSIHGYGVMHGEVTVQPLPTAPPPAPPTPTPRAAPTHVMTPATPRPAPGRPTAAATATATPQTAPSTAPTSSPAVALTLPSNTASPPAPSAPATAVTGVEAGGRQSVLLPVILVVLLLLGLAAGGLVRRRRRRPEP